MRKHFFVFAILLISIIGFLPQSVLAIAFSNVRAVNIIGSQAQIVWQTDTPSDSKVVYGTSPDSHNFISDSRCDGGGDVTSHCVNLTGLTENTTYYYKVISGSNYSGSYQFTSASSINNTSTNIPRAPSDLRLDPAPTPSTIYLRWNDNSDNESGFDIEREVAGSGNWLRLNQTRDNTTAYEDSSVIAGTYYNYRVRACLINYGCSSYVYLNGAKTREENLITAAPLAPSNLTYELSDNGTRVNLSWTDNSTNETRFEIYRQTGGVWNYLSQTEAGVTNFSERPPTGTYYYKVAACNGSSLNTGCSSGSNVIGPITIGALPSSSDSLTVDLKVDGSDGTIERTAPANYTVTWTTTGNPTTCVPTGTWSGSGNKNIPSGSHNFIGVTVLGLKTYGLTCSNGTNSASDTVYVNIVSAASTQIPTIPLAPSGLTATFSPSTNNVVLNWSDNSTNEERFELYNRLAGNSSWNYLYNLPQNSTSSNYPNHPYGTYEYLVKACNYSGCSESNIVTLAIKKEEGNEEKTATPAVNNAFIVGTTTNEKGQPIAGVEIHIYNPKDSKIFFDSVSDKQGNYRLTIPAGNYLIEFFPPLKEGFLKPASQSFEINAGETKRLNVTLNSRATVNKKINGRIAFQNNSPIVDAEVGAYSYASGEWLKTYTDAKGEYSLKVGPGKWKVGFRPVNFETANWRFTNEFREVEFRNDLSEETQTVNFAVRSAETLLQVKAVDDEGKALSGVGVILDTVSSKITVPPQNQLPPEFRRTDSAGLANFRVPIGRYYLRAFLPPEKNLLNPDELSVDVTSTEEKTITITFKQRNRVAEAIIRGVTKLDNGQPTSAFVWAWSENGGFQQIRANDSGEFILPTILGTRWHIGASKEIDSLPYKAQEVVVEVKNQTVSVEIILAKERTAPLPPAVEITREATQTIVAQAQDGAGVIMPPAAAGTSGKVEVAIKPTIEAPSQPATKLLGFAYDIAVKDQSGKSITQFEEEIEIILPYNEADLKKQGIAEDSLTPSFFDEATGAWVRINNYTINKEKNIVIARVKHLTRFAIVVAADTTPPDAPTNIKAVKGGPGEIIISWTNPATDFSHAKIYRSTTKGMLGLLIANDLSGSQYRDRKGSDGVTYYYLVRAVDTAGNESNNLEQVSETMLGQATSSFNRNLQVGARGDDVKLLQQILANEEVYPKKIISGYFGNLTRAAVIKFQEKYAEEILKPAGLSKGTGFVGPATRAKLNKLIP